MLQHTATRCNTLQRTAKHCYTLALQHTATHCTALHRTATHIQHYCNALQHYIQKSSRCNTLQHAATHCITLQHTRTATHCNTLHDTVSHCDAHTTLLQRTATLLQHTATLHTKLLTPTSTSNNYTYMCLHKFVCIYIHQQRQTPLSGVNSQKSACY